MRINCFDTLVAYIFIVEGIMNGTQIIAKELYQEYEFYFLQRYRVNLYINIRLLLFHYFLYIISPIN